MGCRPERSYGMVILISSIQVSGFRCQEFNDLGIKGLRNSIIAEFKRYNTNNT